MFLVSTAHLSDLAASATRIILMSFRLELTVSFLIAELLPEAELLPDIRALSNQQSAWSRPADKSCLTVHKQRAPLQWESAARP